MTLLLCFLPLIQHPKAAEDLYQNYCAGNDSSETHLICTSKVLIQQKHLSSAVINELDKLLLTRDSD